jgi:hypothetical protein
MRAPRLFFLLAPFMLLSLGDILFAENYQYYPGTALGLGKGFDSLLPSRNFPNCLKLTSEYITPAHTAGPFNFHMDLIDTRQQLYNLLHLDVHLAAQTVATSFNADAQFDRETSMSSEDLTWVLYAYQEFGNEELSPSLNNDALPYRNSASKLVSRCGPEYVQTIEKAAELAVVFTIQNIGRTEKSDLRLHFDGGVSWSGGDVNFSLNSRQFFSSAFSQGVVHMRAYGFGGGGITKLAPDLILTPDNFDSVRKTISTYVGTYMTEDRAASVRYITGHFPSLADPPVNVNPAPISPSLLSNFMNYEDLQARVEKIETILRGRNGEFAYLRDDQIAIYQDLRTRLAATLHKLYGILGTCATPSGDCELAPINTEQVNWPQNPETNCTTWKNGVCYKCDFPVRFVSVSDPSTFKFICTRMPPGSKVAFGFDGFITITKEFPDNKVWNSWITAYLDGIDEQCDRNVRRFQYDCSDSRVSPGLGSNLPADQVKLNFFWTYFQLRGTHQLKNPKAIGSIVAQAPETTAVGSLVLSRCATGPKNATCDSVPPGQGSPDQNVSTKGFPFPPELIPAHFFIEAPQANIDTNALVQEERKAN